MFAPHVLLFLLLTLFRPHQVASPAVHGGDAADPSPDRASAGTVVSEGEDLLYEVRWSIFKLGTVRFKTLKDIQDGPSRLHAAVAFMDSYDGVPFVNLHAMTYTEMDSLFRSRGAKSLEKKGARWWILHYIMDQPSGRVFVEESWQPDLQTPPDKRTTIDTLSVDMRLIEDSFSLAFFARAHVRSSETVTLPLIVYGKLGAATMEFTDVPTSTEIDPVDYPIRVVPLRGHLNVEGLFGLTGDFQGWFSDDDACVPIKAKLNVILGSVTVELKAWTRRGWSPPQSSN